MLKSTLELRLSEYVQPFMLSAIDLLTAVREASYVPVEVREAADRLEETIEKGQGKI